MSGELNFSTRGTYYRVFASQLLVWLIMPQTPCMALFEMPVAEASWIYPWNSFLCFCRNTFDKLWFTALLRNVSLYNSFFDSDKRTVTFAIVTLSWASTPQTRHQCECVVKRTFLWVSHEDDLWGRK